MQPGRIYYDGECGLCHGFVRFVLKHDKHAKFRFAPLGDARGPIDTVIVRDASGRMLTRSAAVIHVLEAIGWSVTARLIRMFPRPMRDWGYDWVARVRKRIFPKPEGSCPLVSAELRSRFELPGQAGESEPGISSGMVK